ncbi:Pectinesterase [Pleurostoma richardsiae]|uniref:pectinesterase n=1 Tax=Pleurostoma richardsiae TaxID=41990 RepID=A0AA38VDL1_9PEZI|nr:Pectinesterase [Pleurostoma richardsiae]
MLSLLLLGLSCWGAIAQGAATTIITTSTVNACSSSASTVIPSADARDLLVTTATSASTSSTASTTSALVPATSTFSSSLVTVALDGTGQFTAINAALQYAQSNGRQTVTIKAGTYTESVVIQATAAVTIVGESADSVDYSSNLVTISNTDVPVTYSVATKGVTWRNINFFNTNTSSAAGTVYLRGAQNAFYACQFVAAGSVGISSNYAAGFIANSYLEAADKVVFSYPSLYIYGSTITATSKNALLVYSQGAVSGGVQYNSTVVFDTCSVIQKPGTSNNYVYLAAGNGEGSVVVYRNSVLESLVAPSGAHVDSKTQLAQNTYIEFLTTGAGSYLNNEASRAAYVTWVTDAARLTPILFHLDWISTLVLSLDYLFVFHCSLPSSVPSTALIVGPAGSCANYTSISSAVADLPLDSSSRYVYILAGTYTEQIVFPNARTGATTFRGESTDTLSRSSNSVTIRTSGAVLSSAGGSAATGAFQSTQYYTNQLTFYNIDFENDYTPTTNYQAVAVSIKAKKAAFYSCNINSSQGSLLLNYGSFYFAGCSISGTTDFIWGQGFAYFYNSIIVSDSTTTAQTIVAQQYQTSVGSSGVVFDHSAIVPASASVPKSSTYLGRDYSTLAHVAFVNSYLDQHIAAVGWKVSSSSSAPTFVEGNNTGPGSSTTSRSSIVQVLSDTSAYTAESVLGDISWLDSDAIGPFSGFPDSVYQAATTTTTTTTTASSVAAVSATSTASNSATYTVAPTPAAGQYTSVMSAVAALPNDGKAYTVYILAGEYTEQVWVNRTGMVTLRGETSFPNDFSQNTVKIQFSYGLLTSLNEDELTPVLNSKKTDGSGLALYNIDFINLYPQTSNTAALAADFYGANMAAYGCSFKGYQDTLLANQGVQLFSNCYIEGSVDFIWGYSKAYFHQCYIASNTAGACITAQNRPSATWAGGFVFDSCYITYSSSYGTSYGSTYLGRPWSQYAIAVYMNSYLDKHISSQGWKVWSTSSPQTSDVVFGEYNNSGPGSWSSSRASFATNLTASEAASYTLSSFLGSTSWIDMEAYNYVPSYSVSATASSTASATQTSVATQTSGAIWAHPTDGTVPPTAAVLVSAGGTISGSYSNLTDALASLPDDSSTQIIFMYPGTYSEQVPSIDRSGPVMIIGYTEQSPGRTYSGNTVTITHARGLSVSPLPTGHSDAETATLSTASQVSMYNVDIVNSDNLDGSQSSYVTLAASIYGNKIGFYGCSFTGWQDTLLTGDKQGQQYYESCYIEGAIDFIWGYSRAYFKGCTIGAKRQKSAITAQSRASSSAAGGYIFDQCLFTAAASATVDLTQSVYLGRPYSSYAMVIVKNSYLDDIINPSGWKIWGTSSPNTDHITFAEFNNSGPGNWENNAAARVAWQNCTLLTSDTYPLATVMDTSWLDLTYWDTIVTPTPATAVTTTPSDTEYDGTTPPAGAFIVSKTEIDGVTTYDTIQSALNALPTSSKVTATVFIYPGTYEEQLVLNKSGTTIFIGYSNASSDYAQNQVTITYDKGIDTQADASNSDSATVYATGNYFQAININFANTFGTTKDYATLGFGVKSSKYASLYGCQVYGNQDALLINGYFFAYNSYIEGNIDMIWGSGSGYFLSSTISPNSDDVSLTADKRSTNTSVGGFVFDQCTITPANDDSFSEISLGRPWNAYARVAYIQSYLGSCIEAAGWEQWSKSDPRTDGVLFGEMSNYGPGASTGSRASFATQLTAADAVQFEVANFFSSTSWINMTLVSATPFTAGNVTTPTTSSTIVSSTSSSTLSSSSMWLSTSTVYTTRISTIKETLSLTTTAPDETLLRTSTFTTDVGTTITPSPTTRMSVQKTGTTIMSTIIEPDETVTQTSTLLVNVGSTVTPAATVKTSTVTSESVTSSIKTVTAKASTVKTTTTVTSLKTSTPKPKTVTISIGTTQTSTYTSTPKSVKVTSTTTATVGDSGVTTVQEKATTVYSTVFTTSTSTKKTSTTLTCIPTNAKLKLRRDEPITFRDTIPTLVPRAVEAPAVTVTMYSLYTTDVKTSYVTIPGSTFTSVTSTTKTTGKTVTLKPVTVTSTSVSTSTKYSSTTVPGSTSTVSLVVTKETGKTTTLKPSTSTVLQTVFTTTTAWSTFTLPASTTTSYKTVSVQTTTTLPTSTLTVTYSKDTTVKQTVTQPTGTVTSRETVNKVTTVKITATVTSWETKTSKGAAACTA